MRITGEIVWNEYDLDKEYYSNGIRFTDIPEQFIELLQKYVESSTFDVRK
jgi:hypothetical protein